MDNEKTVILPDHDFLGEKCRELFPIGNAWQSLALALARDSGQEVNAEGVVNWLSYRFIEENLWVFLPIMYEKVIRALIEDELVANAAIAIFKARLQSIKKRAEEA